MDISKTCMLTDQDRMEDMLTSEKYLISVYSSFIPEASCPQLRNVLTENFDGCVKDQGDIFYKMSSMGWYPVKNAPQTEIDAARQKFQQLKAQMSATTATC